MLYVMPLAMTETARIVQMQALLPGKLRREVFINGYYQHGCHTAKPQKWYNSRHTSKIILL